MQGSETQEPLEADEHARAADALRESEERLRLAQSAGGVGVWDWDAESGRAYWSDQMWAIYGLPTGSEPTDSLWKSCILSDDRERISSNIDRFLASMETELHYEFRIVRPNGEIRWVESIARLTRNETGAAVRLSGVNIDITARKQTEEALRASEQRYRQLADAMPQLVWTAEPDGTVDYYNSRAREYSGIEQAADGSWTWQPILHPDDLALTMAAWQAAVASGQTYHCEHRIRMADGSYRWHLSRGVPMRSAADGIEKWFGTATDIHALRTTQEALRQSEEGLRRAAAELSAADRRKDEFLATLAHELRNPLSPIRNALQVLRMSGAPDSRTRWGWDVIDRQVDHLTRLIDDLLDVSRITRNKLELRPQRILLTEVIQAAVENCRPLIDQHRQELTVVLPSEPVALEADLVRLIQILTNLLNNASKYTPAGGTIRLSAERQGAEVQIAVRDTGIGIPPDELPNLFDMFYQVDRTVERSYGGLGIGLTLVRRLVEMHGGTVQAHSAGPHQGSELVVRLPVLAEPAEPRPETGGRGAGGAAMCRILVVDDNADSAESLALMLELSGHEVHVAHDGLEAIEAARELRPGVVLLDLGMPRLSGYEVARRIRSEPWGKGVTLIAQTGWGQDEDRRRTHAAGFDAHLTKPIDHALLRELLGELAAES